jgi:hypothetical protein
MLFSANSSHIRFASMSGDVQSCIAFLRSSKDRNRLTCVYNPIFDFWTLILCYLNLEKFTSNTWTSLKLTLSSKAFQNLTLQTRIASIKVFHSPFLYFSSFLFSTHFPEHINWQNCPCLSLYRLQTEDSRPNCTPLFYASLVRLSSRYASLVRLPR